MSSNFHVYYVNTLPGSIIKLVVDSVDFEVRLFDQNGVEIFSVNKNSLEDVKLNNYFPQIYFRRKYLLRYNNNDGGMGNLNVAIIQFIPGKLSIELNRFNLNSIIGPRVIDIPFTFIRQDSV